MTIKTPRHRPRTLKLRNGTEVPMLEATLKTPAERLAAIRCAAGAIKTKVVVDRSFYRSGGH